MIFVNENGIDFDLKCTKKAEPNDPAFKGCFRKSKVFGNSLSYISKGGSPSFSGKRQSGLHTIINYYLIPIIADLALGL